MLRNETTIPTSGIGQPVTTLKFLHQRRQHHAVDARRDDGNTILFISTYVE